jgi:hypothetical protein
MFITQIILFFIWIFWIIREKIIFITHIIILTHVGGRGHVQAQLGGGCGRLIADFGVASTPNSSVGEHVSRPNLGLGIDTSNPNLGVGVDASRPNLGVGVVGCSKLGVDMFKPTLGLGVDSSRPNLGLGVDPPRLGLGEYASTPNLGLGRAHV